MEHKSVFCYQFLDRSFTVLLKDTVPCYIGHCNGRIISSTNFNAQFNNIMCVTLLSSTCFGPWYAHPQDEQLHKHSIWYPRSHKRLYTTPVERILNLVQQNMQSKADNNNLCQHKGLLSTGVVYSRLWERGYQMLCLCSCSSWGWASQVPKHVEDGSVTYKLLLTCALKLVEEIILYYDARSKKHQNNRKCFPLQTRNLMRNL